MFGLGLNGTVSTSGRLVVENPTTAQAMTVVTLRQGTGGNLVIMSSVINPETGVQYGSTERGNFEALFSAAYAQSTVTMQSAAVMYLLAQSRTYTGVVVNPTVSYPTP